MHARILLKADSSEDGPDWTDQVISEALEIGTATVERVRQRLVEEGVAAALTRQCLDRSIGSRTELEREVAVWPSS